VDVIVSDDGLQHHRLPRDVEWVIVDGRRGLGNGFCLPAGPLREHPRRLESVDAVLVNGGGRAPGLPRDEHGAPLGERVDFALQRFRDLRDGATIPVERMRGERVTAMAGIGNPERFFARLEAEGLRVDRVPLDDHATPDPDRIARLRRKGRRIVITEKDAVKWPLPPQRPDEVLVAEGGIALPEGPLARLLATLDARRTPPKTR